MPRFLVDIVRCKTCGQQIQIWKEEDTSFTGFHTSCAAPSFDFIVHQPKRLGVLTSEAFYRE